MQCTAVSYTSDPFPLDQNRALAAVFWADADTTGTGDVEYFQTTSIDLIDRANQLVNEGFTLSSPFQATNLFVATWSEIGYANARTDKVRAIIQL